MATAVDLSPSSNTFHDHDLDHDHGHVSVVIFGASGDLARKKLYPALCSLYCHERLPSNVRFIGFGRSSITVRDIRSKCEQFTTIDWNHDKCESFWQLNSYFCGNYENANSFEDLDRFIMRFESLATATPAHRLFYLAIPPNIYESVAAFISSKCQSKSGWNRIIIEKPFGRDLTTYEQLSRNISKHFSEENIFRIDHYLGKEMVQNLLTLRFANRVFDETWNNKHISSVLITFKESIDIESRGGYFDNYGIIRDVLQNHLMQIFTLIAMDKPDSVTANDIRRKKLELLASVEEARVSDTILGQYADYCENKSIMDKNSRTATYAAVVLRVQNARWAGVPFILKCGKALNERKTEIRIRYKDVDANIFADHSHISPNEFVIIVQPDEAMYLKFMTKVPGIEFNIKQSELDLTYKKRFIESKTSEAYERLILEVLYGSQTNFVCTEELHESWRILTPLLQQTDDGKLIPYRYERNTRGPIEADNLVRENGYTYSNDYEWNSYH